MTNSLKVKATKGFIWTALDKFGVNIIQFVFGVVLARLLEPSDFGLIGMLSLFIVLSQTFIDSGLGSSLIQKIDRNEIDFSTVFVANLCFSLILYVVLFFSANFIANFYSTPSLADILRVLAIILVINSFGFIQRIKLTIDLNFKFIAISNITSILLSGIVSIWMAMNNFGVWSLVGQTVLKSLIFVLIIMYLNRWNLSFKFSYESYKSQFKYSSKLLISGIYTKIMQEVNNIAIGKYYTSTDLGFYSRAKYFAEVNANSITSILHQVTFPILSSLQTDKNKLVSVYRRVIKMTAFITFPIMTLLSVLSDPLIRLFLTDKWEPAIELLQIMAIARMFYPISVINTNILNATGRSDLYLKTTFLKAPITILTLFITIPLGIKAMVIGHLITSVISFFINALWPGKLFGYGGFKQLKDMLFCIGYCLVFYIVSLFILGIITNYILQITTITLLMLVTYSFYNFITKSEESIEIYNFIKNKFNK